MASVPKSWSAVFTLSLVGERSAFAELHLSRALDVSDTFNTQSNSLCHPLISVTEKLHARAGACPSPLLSDKSQDSNLGLVSPMRLLFSVASVCLLGFLGSGGMEEEEDGCSLWVHLPSIGAPSTRETLGRPLSLLEPVGSEVSMLLSQGSSP